MILNQQRLPIVIGKNGDTKKLIEKLTRTRIEIDSKTGDVVVLPTEEKQEVVTTESESVAKVKSDEQLLQKAAAEVEEDLRSEGHSEEKSLYQAPNPEENVTIGGEELPQLENLGNLNVWIAENIIKAINRGFNPEKALRLLSDEFMLEIIDLEPILGRSEKAITRVKGRIIGESGTMRTALEQFASCFISVFGNTIAIIAQFEDLRVARKALQMLIQGVPHKNVYSFLEKKYKEKKDENIKKLWKPTF